MMGIEDSYTAFCFDEACALIVSRIEKGEEPIFRKASEESSAYSRPSEVYSKYKHGEVK